MLRNTHAHAKKHPKASADSQIMVAMLPTGDSFAAHIHDLIDLAASRSNSAIFGSPRTASVVESPGGRAEGSADPGPSRRVASAATGGESAVVSAATGRDGGASGGAVEGPGGFQPGASLTLDENAPGVDDNSCSVTAERIAIRHGPVASPQRRRRRIE